MWQFVATDLFGNPGVAGPMASSNYCVCVLLSDMTPVCTDLLSVSQWPVCSIGQCVCVCVCYYPASSVWWLWPNLYWRNGLEARNERIRLTLCGLWPWPPVFIVCVDKTVLLKMIIGLKCKHWLVLWPMTAQLLCVCYYLLTWPWLTLCSIIVCVIVLLCYYYWRNDDNDWYGDDGSIIDQWQPRQ